MICPRCKTDLKNVSLQDVEVDICGSCEGVWFDHGELAKIIKGGEEGVGATELAKSWEGEAIKDEHPGEKELACPRCSGLLRRYNYSYSSNVVIDGCEEKRCGVWIDDGELKRIAQYLCDYRKNLSPEQKEELVMKLAQIKNDCETREEAFIDSLVKMDDQGGIMRVPGEILQFIYTMMYKIGL
jgi:Zn-finger nucleic acid-binding protein